LARPGRGRFLALGLRLGLRLGRRPGVLGRHDAAFLGGRRLLATGLGLLGGQDATLLALLAADGAGPLAAALGVGRRDRAGRGRGALGVLGDRGILAAREREAGTRRA